MIAGAVQKNLRLVFHPPKGARMNDPRPVALKFRSIRMARLGIFAAARVAGFLRKRRQRSPLSRLHLLASLPTFVHDKITNRLSILVSSVSDFPAKRAALCAIRVSPSAHRKAPAKPRSTLTSRRRSKTKENRLGAH